MPPANGMTTPITDPKALEHLCEALRGAAWIALDTEFVRERTYYARLALIQVAIPEVVACVDPLALDIAPLLEVLYADRTLKVLHAARQDLEVFYDVRAVVPQPLFDTQIAAALAGHAPQIGYGALVETVAGVALPKLHTRADWEARPLAPAWIAYALDDVRYLRDVYAHLAARLEALGRDTWLMEECAALAEPALYRNDPMEAWRRIKAGPGLAPEVQPLLRLLAAWRERTAQARNLPRAWVAPDSDLIAVAQARPATHEALTQSVDGRSSLARRFASEILEVVEQALTLPPERLWPEPHPLTAAEKAEAERLSARIHTLAQKLELHPTVIGGRKAIHDLVLTGAGALTRGWRAALLASHPE